MAPAAAAAAGVNEFWRERRGDGARLACCDVGADQNS